MSSLPQALAQDHMIKYYLEPLGENITSAEEKKLIRHYITHHAVFNPKHSSSPNQRKAKLRISVAKYLARDRFAFNLYLERKESLKHFALYRGKGRAEAWCEAYGFQMMNALSSTEVYDELQALVNKFCSDEETYSSSEKPLFEEVIPIQKAIRSVIQQLMEIPFVDRGQAQPLPCHDHASLQDQVAAFQTVHVPVDDWDIPQSLLPFHEGENVVMRRQSNIELLQGLSEWAREFSGPQDVHVTGTAGIGTSVFIWQLIAQLLRERFTVFYYTIPDVETMHRCVYMIEMGQDVEVLVKQLVDISRIEHISADTIVYDKAKFVHIKDGHLVSSMKTMPFGKRITVTSVRDQSCQEAKDGSKCRKVKSEHLLRFAIDQQESKTVETGEPDEGQECLMVKVSDFLPRNEVQALLLERRLWQTAKQHQKSVQGRR